MKRVLTILTLFMASAAHSMMIMNKGDWSKLTKGEQVGYVIAAIDSTYFVLSSDENEKTRRRTIAICIQGMDTDDFIGIIDMRYQDLENYGSPPWFQLDKGLERVCGVT